MKTSVICISHTDGAGGEEIGRLVAAKLGYRYVDQELIVAAARRAQVAPEVVAEAEKKQSLLEKILDALSLASETLGPATLAAGVGVPTWEVGFPHQTTRDDLRLLIRSAIHEYAKSGNCVIGAHAASLALGEREGVLRVLVTAPLEVRRSRLATASDLSEKEAAEAIAAGDAGRREYMRVFYDIDDELPTLYDLVLNTAALAPERAAAVIAAAAAD